MATNLLTFFPRRGETLFFLLLILNWSIMTLTGGAEKKCNLPVLRLTFKRTGSDHSQLCLITGLEKPHAGAGGL